MISSSSAELHHAHRRRMPHRLFTARDGQHAMCADHAQNCRMALATLAGASTAAEYARAISAGRGGIVEDMAGAMGTLAMPVPRWIS